MRADKNSFKLFTAIHRIENSDCESNEFFFKFKN